MRSTAVAYILWALPCLGVFGVHRFYCGKIGTGLLWFFTGGLLGIGWLVDAFLIPDMVREANETQPPLFGNPYASNAPPQYVQSPVQGAPPAHRVIYCTHCGKPILVPAASAGSQYACPSCRTVVIVPG